MNAEMPDFDVLITLHERDPDAFERLRRNLLRAAVDSAPPAYRTSLERVLDRIEDARASAATPAESALVAFQMMNDSVRQLRNHWDDALCAAAQLQAALLIERARR